LAVIAGWVSARFVPKPLPELSRQEFLAEVRAGHVHKVVIEDQEVITAVSSTRGEFRTGFKAGDNDLLAELRARGIEVVSEKSTPGLI
jgi:hypothetical protein